jgi:creatinine amidohydrolase
VAELKRRAYSDAEIGLHAGLADTALTLALDPSLVRSELLAAGAGKGAGVNGDPRRASGALGQLGVDRIVEASTIAIRAALLTPPPPNRTRQP